MKPKLKIDTVGNKFWKLFGRKLHRTDGPAIEFVNGTKNWYKNGKLHRIDGPAIIWNTGDKEWYKNGKLHRTDGPAIENINDHKEWWINDKQYSKQKYAAKIRQMKLQKILNYK